jgi:acetoacetyl-CoA synthetase
VLSSSALGGIFSSVSIELASSGCLDRLSAIKPKVLFATPVYCFNGQIIDASERLSEVVKDLGPRGLQHVVLVNHLGIQLPNPPKTQQVTFWTYEEFRSFGQQGAPKDIPFWRGPAMAPLWILFSSGTTGKPKGLIHSAVGMILTTKVAQQIHASVTGVDLQMQASTLSWVCAKPTRPATPEHLTNDVYRR